MIKLRLKNEEFKFIRYMLKIWEFDDTGTKSQQRREIRILDQLTKKFALT
jgi:hypothetical protein